MVTLFVSHIRPILDYCSTLWNLGYMNDVRRLEGVQRRWTKEVAGLGDLDYLARLRVLGLYSVYGRMFRADLIKIWKAFHADVDVGLQSRLFLRDISIDLLGDTSSSCRFQGVGVKSGGVFSM